MTLGEIIRKLRQRQFSTLREGAQQLNISHVHLCNLEHDKAEPSLSLIAKMEKVFGLNPFVVFSVLKDDSPYPATVVPAAMALRLSLQKDLTR